MTTRSRLAGVSRLLSYDSKYVDFGVLDLGYLEPQGLV